MQTLPERSDICPTSMHIEEGSPDCIQLGKSMHHDSCPLHHPMCWSLGSHIASSLPTPSASIAWRCSEVILAHPPSRHPSLPAIPAAAPGLAVHPHNLNRIRRGDKGEFISKGKWKLSKNNIYHHVLATCWPLSTTAVWDLCYKLILLTTTLRQTPYLE